MAVNIGIFCDAFRPENKAVAIRLYYLAEAFQKKGFNVVVQTSTRNASDSKLNVRHNIFNAPSNEGSNLARLLGEVLLGTEMFFRVLFSRYDLVLISSPPFVASCMGSWAAKIRGTPYIFDVRDEYPEVFISAGLISEKSMIGRMLLLIEKLAYRNALIVTTVTEGICKRIDEKLKTQNRAVLLRNGFDGDLFMPSAEKEKMFSIIFHGNIGKFQDPELILKIARKAHAENLAIQFNVIGWGNNDDMLKKEIPPNVRYLGKVDYNKIPALISKAHLGISFRSDDLISKNSFPVKIYEYIGVGLPVMVTPRSEAGDFVEKNQMGFQFDPDDMDGIFNKIQSLHADHSKLSVLAQHVVSIRSDFSRQSLSEKFVNHVVAQWNQLSPRKV